MSWILAKYLFTAFIVVIISEVAKKNDKLGALIAALPVITILVLVWMYLEGQSDQKLSNHAYYTFWYVLPTLPMFLAFPWLLERYQFFISLLLCALLSLLCFLVTAVIAKYFGVNLM